MTSQQKYEAFIASMDTSIAGRDVYGDLRWHVECSAETNAGDTLVGKVYATHLDYEEAFYRLALDTAIECVCEWETYYPQLMAPADSCAEDDYYREGVL